MGQCQFGPEQHKHPRKTFSQPVHDPWPFDDVASKRTGKQTVDDEDGEGECHEGQAEQAHLGGGSAGIRGDELWQEGQKEHGQFRVERVDQDGVADDFDGMDRIGFGGDFHRTRAAPHAPRHVKQPRHAKIAQGFKGKRTGVQQGRKAQDACPHGGQDAERTAKGRPDARPHAAPKANGKGIDHPCTG